MPRDPRRGLPLIARTRRVAELHRDSSEIVVASEFMRRLMLRNGFRPEQVHVVPYFTSLPPSEVTVVPPVEGRILCAARLVPEKGVALLLRALAGLRPPAHVIVAGEGPARRELERLSSALGLGARVTFAGWLSRHAMACALREAQVVAIPSVWPEPFGIIGIEAMAAARPAVSYDVGGVREWLVDGDTGLLVPPASVDALGRAIGSLLNDPARARALGARGREIAQARFGAETHVRLFSAVVKTAIARWTESHRGA